jgi:tRNA U38,U39,U40 pseudouridine synthase TruA
MDKLKEAARFLSGKKNYLTFTSPKYFCAYQDPVKTLNIVIRPSHLWMEDYSRIARDKLKCYDFIFIGNSFLYHMVSFSSASSGH